MLDPIGPPRDRGSWLEGMDHLNANVAEAKPRQREVLTEVKADAGDLKRLRDLIRLLDQAA